MQFPALVAGEMKRPDSSKQCGAAYIVAVGFLLASLLNLPAFHESHDDLISALNEDTTCFVDLVDSDSESEDDNRFPAVQPEQAATVLSVSGNLRPLTAPVHRHFTFPRQARAPPQFLS